MPIRLSPVVLNLIIINVLVFLFLNLSQDNPFIFEDYFLLHKTNALGFWDVLPAGANTDLEYYVKFQDGIPIGLAKAGQFQPLQLITSMFSHIDLLHILFNMMSLAFLGPAVEHIMGSRRFLEMWLFTGLFAGLCLAFFDPSPNPVLGASTAVSGMFVLFAHYYPRARLSPMFLPFSFPAKNVVLFFAGLSLVLTVVGLVSDTGRINQISHFGHLMGMAGGLLYLNKNRLLGLFKR